MTNVVKSSPDCERQRKEQDFRRASSRFLSSAEIRDYSQSNLNRYEPRGLLEFQ